MASNEPDDLTNDDFGMTPQELEDDLLRRFISGLLRVPRVCRVRRCRRMRRCVGPGPLCYYDHSGLVRQRFNHLMDDASSIACRPDDGCGGPPGDVVGTGQPARPDRHNGR